MKNGKIFLITVYVLTSETASIRNEPLDRSCLNFSLLNIVSYFIETNELIFARNYSKVIL